jgi:hypothetical protein
VTPETEAIERTPSSHAVPPPAVRLSSKIQDAPPRQEISSQELSKTISDPAPAAIAAEIIASTLAAEPVAKVQAAPEPQQMKAQESPKATPQPAPAPVATVKTAAPVAAKPVVNVPNPSVQSNKNPSKLPTVNAAAAPAPVVNKAVALPVEAAPKKTTESAATNKSASAGDAGPTQSQPPDTKLQNESLANEPSQGQERTIVFNKLLHLGSARQKQTAPAGNTSETKAQVTTPEAKLPRASQSTMTARAIPPNQGNLLPLQDIYLAVGIASPRLGYNIDTVSGMLDSDHLRGMTSEVNRASVLMALEAAGTPVNELLQDGAKRLDALNNYEAAERKRFEDYEARKSQENAQIQSEIERMTAHCLERIKHNLSEVTLAKDAFLNWQTTKQKEAQRISEAVALFSKSPSAEAPGDAKPELQTAGAESKR